MVPGKPVPSPARRKEELEVAGVLGRVNTFQGLPYYSNNPGRWRLHPAGQDPEVLGRAVTCQGHPDKPLKTMSDREVLHLSLGPPSPGHSQPPDQVPQSLPVLSFSWG